MAPKRINNLYKNTSKCLSTSTPRHADKSEGGNGGGERNADEPDEHTCDLVADGS